MSTSHVMTMVAVMLAIGGRPSVAAVEESHDAPPAVVVNDNQTAAGRLEGNTLRLALRAGLGSWRPEGREGPALIVEALGEIGGALQVPSPLIRVPEGTEVAVDIRNDLDTPLRVHGLCARDGSPCAPLDVPAAAAREVRFRAPRAGTYHYWATTTGFPLAFRALRDTQLSGAFVVDEPGRTAAADRVLVITDWTNLTRAQLDALASAADPGATFRAIDPRFTFLVNGLSWPATERLQYQVGDDVRWRVINLSTQIHPMHLHGFHFRVDSVGDGLRDVPFDPAAKPVVVTQVLDPGGTMTMVWRPGTPGNWIFHCHVSAHIAPTLRLAEPGGDHASHGAHGVLGGMAGLIVGVTITAPDSAPAFHGPGTPELRPTRSGAASTPAQRFTLLMRTEAGHYGEAPAYGFELADIDELPDVESTTRPTTLSVPGPTLVVRRGEPVEIALVNQLPEATSIHWHGMELDSYYDGVHGWSGAGTRVTPLIEPGGRFLVRFAPPRAGTFIYHTHMHDHRQLTSGMYGALVVLEPGETFDPVLDHVLVIGRGGPGPGAPVVVNGQNRPALRLRPDARHRLRLVNITPDDILTVSLTTPQGPLTWRTLAKDAVPVPGEPAPRAAVQRIAVGETYDFEYVAPPGRQAFWLDVRTPSGRWEAQGRIVVVSP
jgi:FtsP/CotA-like multicopper oxidase with cupredoxin domain